MKALLSPESFVDDYLYPIWEWFTDMFWDFQEVFKVNRISQYIFYLIWIEVLILPFAFWLIMSFVLSYRNKRVTFLGISKFKEFSPNLRAVSYNGTSVRSFGFLRSSLRSNNQNKYLGTLTSNIKGSTYSTLKGNNIRPVTPRIKRILHFTPFKLNRFTTVQHNYITNNYSKTFSSDDSISGAELSKMKEIYRSTYSEPKQSGILLDSEGNVDIVKLNKAVSSAPIETSKYNRFDKNGNYIGNMLDVSTDDLE